MLLDKTNFGESLLILVKSTLMFTPFGVDYCEALTKVSPNPVLSVTHKVHT